MQLIFDNLEEFHDAALAFGYVRKADQAVLTTPAKMSPEELQQWAQQSMNTPIATGAALDAVAEQREGNEPAPTGQPDSTSTDTGAESSSEPKKRTRRTKAQIAADAAAESAAANLSESAQSSSNVGVASAQSTNPFEAQSSNPSEATQAILNAPTGQAATLAGIAAMQANPFDPAQAAVVSEPVASATTAEVGTAAQPTGDAASYIEARSLELLTNGDAITPVSHMHKCRDFIAKHGQALYVTTFPLATLPMTVATFKPDQCARHQAAMEFAAQSAV